MGNNVIFIGAHPDDIELGCGGTVSKHLELGDEVFVLIMTNGEQGNHPSNREECLNSLRTLGLKESNLIFGNFPDGYLPDNRDVVKFVEENLNKLSITKVYTHDPNDRHQDHRNCSKAVSSAARKIPELLLFQGYSTNAVFEPHYFIELSEEHLKKKIDALSCYKTQIEKGCINLKFIENLALVNGGMGNMGYAEAFALNHVSKQGQNV